MPKLLLFVDWFYPAFRAGGPIRSCLYLVQRLKEHFDVYVLTSDRDLGAQQQLPVERFNAWVEMADGIKVSYLEFSYQDGSYYRKIIQQLKPDVVMVNGLWSSRFSLLPLRVLSGLTNPPKVVVAPRGMLLDAHLQKKHWKKWPVLQVLKRWPFLKRISWLATTTEEAQAIVQQLSIDPDQVTTLSNFAAPVQNHLKTIDKEPGSLKLICSSRIYSEKNQHFLLELLAAIPEDLIVECTLVGSRDVAYWRSMKKVMMLITHHVRVTYGGEVRNEDIGSILQQHHLFILPTLGENFGHAIFEAWAAGRPVLISDRTPWRDLQAKGIGWDLSLEDRSAWIAALETMASLDQDAFDAMCEASLDFARQYHDNLQLEEKYLELFA